MKQWIRSALIILATTTAHAHGEDKPGPHGGQVQMPGAFHTEVKAEKDNSIKVYLLDMNFKNPSTKDSSVSATLTNDKKTVTLACKATNDHYVCTSPKKTALIGDLKIQATRESAKGNEATYKLPLHH